MPILPSRLYDLDGERYDLSLNLRFNPTASVPESCMLDMSEAEKDQIDQRIIQVRRKLYGGGAHPDRIDIVALANKEALKAMAIRRTFAIIAAGTTSSLSFSSPSPAATITSGTKTRGLRRPRQPLWPQERLAPAPPRNWRKKCRERQRRRKKHHSRKQ
ncbi:hypothetical protein BG015_006018 [Linnemannia schmuckeri]|uniref:Uncharacterized protein n=1 Tax=Linnemannia schmuckeri TaxID=64567 RepID=A0A9P5R4K4_9FUNG|nr:hypothetical protein BG015_006018 [Linnemannia schmuckeri]